MKRSPARMTRRPVSPRPANARRLQAIARCPSGMLRSPLSPARLARGRSRLPEEALRGQRGHTRGDVAEPGQPILPVAPNASRARASRSCAQHRTRRRSTRPRPARVEGRTTTSPARRQRRHRNPIRLSGAPWPSQRCRPCHSRVECHSPSRQVICRDRVAMPSADMRTLNAPLPPWVSRRERRPPGAQSPAGCGSRSWRQGRRPPPR